MTINHSLSVSGLLLLLLHKLLVGLIDSVEETKAKAKINSVSELDRVVSAIHEAADGKYSKHPAKKTANYHLKKVALPHLRGLRGTINVDHAPNPRPHLMPLTIVPYNLLSSLKISI